MNVFRLYFSLIHLVPSKFISFKSVMNSPLLCGRRSCIHYFNLGPVVSVQEDDRTVESSSSGSNVQ